MDGSILLPFDKLKAELFYPERTENIDTKDLSTKMVLDMASFLLTELRYPKKEKYNYLSSGEGKFSWGYTTQE